KLNFQGAVRIDGNFTRACDRRGLCSGKAVLHKTANLQGDLVTPTLVVEEGAVLEGRVTMSSSSSSATETETEEIS
ncbi:polymer-forming cytoskeletal protein, partial [Aduncisulcus paluster]